MTRIPVVRLCEMTDCGFNDQRLCHAAAVQIGDALGTMESPVVATTDPRCDTYTPRPQAHLGAPDLTAQIGSCKMEACIHNDHFRCTAEAITVGHHDSHADCRTFKTRT